MHTLYILDTGSLSWRDPETGEMVSHPVPCYLIRTASGRHILVDSGNPSSLVGAKTAAPWFHAPMAMNAAQTLERQLAGLGLAVSDISLLVSTHFDFDHCGNHPLFAGTGIPSIVQAAQLEDALASDRYDPDLWNMPGLTHEPVDGDHELEPGLTLLETSGHAPGHQSLYVETTGGPVILAIDAIIDESTLGDGPWPSFYFSDPGAALRSRDRLRQLAAETGATLIFGHDPEQWLSLPKSPEPYRGPLDRG